MPLRLGFDVFEKKFISPEKEEMVINTIKSYKLLADVYEVKHMKAAPLRPCVMPQTGLISSAR